MKRALVLSALLCGSGAALAQPALNPGIETRLNFEDGKVVFQPFGDTSQISITREAANVKEGRAAMRFDYQIGAGQINAALAVGKVGAVANIKSFRFWVKADYATTLVMVLQEQGGGRYIAMFHAPKLHFAESQPRQLRLGKGVNNRRIFGVNARRGRQSPITGPKVV